MSSANRIPGKGREREAAGVSGLRILGPRSARIRRPGREIIYFRVGARGARRESNRARVHRGSFGRFFIQGVICSRICESTHFCAARRRIEIAGCVHCGGGALRAAERISRSPARLRIAEDIWCASWRFCDRRQFCFWGKSLRDGYLGTLKSGGKIVSRAGHVFGHGVEADVGEELPRLFGVYHPSQQNTQTGRVTEAMYAKVLQRVRKSLNGDC